MKLLKFQKEINPRNFNIGILLLFFLIVIYALYSVYGIEHLDQWANIAQIISTLGLLGLVTVYLELGKKISQRDDPLDIEVNANGEVKLKNRTTEQIVILSIKQTRLFLNPDIPINSPQDCVRAKPKLGEEVVDVTWYLVPDIKNNIRFKNFFIKEVKNNFDEAQLNPTSFNQVEVVPDLIRNLSLQELMIPEVKTMGLNVDTTLGVIVLLWVKYRLGSSGIEATRVFCIYRAKIFEPGLSWLVLEGKIKS